MSSWSDTRQLRVGLLVLGAALLLNAHFFTIGWDYTLLGHHQFRQVQTALASFHYLQDGLSLHYVTPLLGPPWEVPLEFPTYELSAAACARLTGIDLDPAGRLAAWLWFIGALPACFLLLRRFQLPLGHRLLFPALLLLTPIYLFYSRTFLIESTALFLSCWFLLGFERFMTRASLGWWVLAAIFGSFAGMTKATTFAVFLIAGLLILFAELRRGAGGKAAWRKWIRAGSAVCVPLAATGWWVFHSASIRHLNPDAKFLDGVLGAWTFGDFAQRFSWTYWVRTFRVWVDAIVGSSGLALLAIYFLLFRGRHRRAIAFCAAAFLSGQLVFANLYSVHDYYFYANALFLVAAVGFALVDLLDQPGLPRWGGLVLIAAALALQVSAFDRTFLEAQRTNTPVPASTELVRSITSPDDLIVIFGQDWDGALPYYAERKALMILSGRELDPAAVQRSIARLDRSKVGAVILSGYHWRDSLLVDRIMPGLDLGHRPLLANLDATGIWVPAERQELVRERFNSRQFPDFVIEPEAVAPGLGITLNTAQIRRRREFDCFHPRPIHAHGSYDFIGTIVDSRKMLVAHSTSELTFRLPKDVTRFSATCGLSDESYTNGRTTDGIEIRVSLKPAQGPEQVLYSRHINPRANDRDRGPQKIAVDLPPRAVGELMVRLLPGPAGDASFDWSYIGDGEIR